MNPEKSTASVVLAHIITSSLVMPFFGLLAGYFVDKFLHNSLDKNSLVILRDIVYIIFFFIGVKYSLFYINNTITVKNPQKSSTYSIALFGLIIFVMLIVDILSTPNLINIIYNTLFFSIIFLIFFVLTRNYFKKLVSS